MKKQKIYKALKMYSNTIFVNRFKQSNLAPTKNQTSINNFKLVL